MKLFTVQDQIVGSTLKGKRVWRASLEKSNELTNTYGADDEEVRPLFECYDWIHKKAKTIVGEPAEAGQALIWASDFTEIGNYKSVRFNGQKCCKIELNIPDELVMRVAYDPWCVAIVGGFIWSSEWSEEEFCQKYDEYESFLEKKFGSSRCIEAMLYSLEEFYLDYDNPNESWQYLFWEIRPEWVTDIEFFTAETVE